MHPESQPLSPVHLFETITGYQKSAALKAAIELDVCTAIAEGHTTAAAIAERCSAAERGIRILCDYLTVHGFLTKENHAYHLTPDSAAFLNRHAPAYMGRSIDFLLDPFMTRNFTERLTESVRHGGNLKPEANTVSPDNPLWVNFARGMMPMMAMPAQLIADRLASLLAAPPRGILDIAAGHGIFGVTLAAHFPEARVTALDWPNVLEVARENAAARGVADRWRALPGSAFETEFGEGYDVVLLTNFLHHFDPETCEGLLRKIHAALTPNGCVATLEFVPNDDRVTPIESAGFSLVMLAGTPAGDAYTFAEFERMFHNAGFARSSGHRLYPTPQTLIVSHK